MKPRIEYMQTGAVAQALAVSAERVRQLERAGVLPVAARTTGGLRLFDAAAVHELAEQRRRKAAEAAADAA